jgi:CSLREA domain-containing protein
MRPRPLAAILTKLVLALVSPCAANAAGGLDQQQTDTSGGGSLINSGASLAQTLTAYLPPYDPDFIVNRPIPSTFPTDPNSANAVSALTSFVTGHQGNVHLKASGEVPPINVTRPNDGMFNVKVPGSGVDGTTFKGPFPPVLGSGSDHPTLVLNPENWQELRIWQATVGGSCPGNTLCGSGGGHFYWNNDNAILNPDSACNEPGDRLPCESLGQPHLGTGAGNGLSYLAGLIVPEEVDQGAINHAVRVAGVGNLITSTYRPPARKSDQSGSSTGAVPMGSIFQLKPSVNCDGRTLPSDAPNDGGKQLRFLKQLCRAFQDFGLMVSDGAGSNLSIYLEADATANWRNSIGSPCPSSGSFGFIVRPSGSNCGTATSGGTDGIPWGAGDWRLVSAPPSYTDSQPPAQPATFTVNTTADPYPGDGVCDAFECTLRDAINAANLNPATDAISFDIAGSPPYTITPTASLPAITDPAVIDATTEPDFAGSPVVEIDGGINANLTITAGDSTIRGFVINRANSQIGLYGNGGNTVEGNYLGTNVSGTAPAPATGVQNATGVVVASAGNTIGGTTSAARNVISGNSARGVWLQAPDNEVKGNFIGTNGAGTAAVSNLIGVETEVSENVIGGTGSGASNEIAFNGTGVHINGGTADRILSNSIHDNGGLGIDVGLDGVTANDTGDGDAGPNNLQNFPTLQSAQTTGGTTTIEGELDAQADPNPYRLEFFSSPGCDGSGNGEGRTYLGTTNVTSGGSPQQFTFTPASQVAIGDQVTATATAPDGSTSEFAPCEEVAPQPARIAVIEDAMPNDPQNFSFTAGGGLSPTSFLLDDDDDGALSDLQLFDFVTPSQTYSITQADTPGWYRASASCDNGDDPASVSPDPGQTVTCIFVNARPYARPGSATPLRVPLVPAYADCTSPNTSHVAPLDYPACDPPAPMSALLEVGTLGQGSGFAKFNVVVGDPGTPADEADIGINMSATDVRNASDDADYTGQVVLSTRMRITDSANGSSGQAQGTTQDAAFGIPVSCVATGGAAGATCSVMSTLDTLVPGIAKEGKLAVISALSLSVLDAGADGSIAPGSGTCPPTCGSGDESTFLSEGVFEP